MNIEIAAAIILFKNKLLISQRTEQQTLAGYWEFPGGKVLENESLEACVVREVEEELAFQVKPRKKVWQTCYAYPDQKLELNFFSCDRIGGEPRAIQCKDFKWIFPEDLTLYRFPSANHELIQKLTQRELSL